MGVFLPATIHKVSGFRRFVPALAAYRLLPTGVEPAVAVLLAIAESLVILSLSIGWLLDLGPTGFVLAAALLGLYGVAIGINLWRGRQFIDCGCGDAPTGLGWGLLLRNSLLVGCALLGSSVVPSAATTVQPLELVLGIALGLLGWVLYQSTDQLLTNASIHRRLWGGV